MLHAHLVAKTRPAALKENIICFNDTRVTVLSPRLFRIEKEPEGRFLDEATQAVWFRDMPPTPCGFREEDGRYVIETEAARLTVCDPLSDSFVTFPDGKTAAADEVARTLPFVSRRYGSADFTTLKTPKKLTSNWR